MTLPPRLKSLAVCAALCSGMAHAITVSFFDSSQSYALDTSGQTFNTLTSEGYRFTYSQDKLFTGGVGLTIPIGRSNSISWPVGLHAQGITVDPVDKARVTIQRTDGNVFDIEAFSTVIYSFSSAGADFEVVPKLLGEDLYNDPVYFPGTGNTGIRYTYNRSGTIYPGGLTYGQSTSPLTGADSYTIAYFGDFGLTGITLHDASNAGQIPEPETYKMLLAGLGVLAAVSLRKTRKQA